MIVSWPTDVPICAVRNSTRGRPENNTIAFASEYGLGPSRPRSSVSIEFWDIQMAPMTREQYVKFEAWRTGDIAHGARYFLRPHPITGAPRQWRMTTPPEVAKGVKDYVSVNFAITGPALSPWFAPYVPEGTGRVPQIVADYPNSVFGVNGEPTPASAVASAAGTYDVYETADGFEVFKPSKVIEAGDIPASAPSGVERILAFDP